MELSSDLIKMSNKNSLYETIGIEIKEISNGSAKSQLKPNPKICWPFPDQVPGGILFTLMDTTMAWAIISEVEQGFSCSSLHLDIQYTALARGETFKCDARIKYKTERTHFLQAEIMDEEGKIVAIGQGTFRIFSLSK